MDLLLPPLLLLLLLLVSWHTVIAHNYLSDKDHVNKMKIFSSTPGVMTSFENSLVSGDHFLGYSGWEKINRQYSVENITIIVRIEFDRFSYKHRRLKKTYNRITRSLKMHIYNLRWLAKLNFSPDVSFEFRELRQFGKFLTDLPGLACAWVHPRVTDKYSLLVKFDGKRVPSRKFFYPTGFHSWDDLNSQYQVSSVSYLRGWNRALINFESGLHCKESSQQVATKYNNLPGVLAVYRDEYQNCRMTYRILLKFDGRFMTPRSLHFYQDWSSLNYMYGVVNVSFHEDIKLIAHLEFEPGLYTNHQMKAIRSEYLKLKGIMFGWVEGTYPSKDTRIAVKFESHLDMRNYTKWNHLNTLYFSQIKSINHNTNQVIIHLPEGRFSPAELASIHQEYEALPGVLSVKPRRAQGRGQGRLAALRNTWWVRLEEEKGRRRGEEMSNETAQYVKHTPLYHRERNRTENSLWENHCGLH